MPPEDWLDDMTQQQIGQIKRAEDVYREASQQLSAEGITVASLLTALLMIMRELITLSMGPGHFVPWLCSQLALAEAAEERSADDDKRSPTVN